MRVSAFHLVFVSTLLLLPSFGASPLWATITGTVFQDYDQDGAQDPGELGLAGVMVQAYDSNNAPVGAAATTSATGTYTLATTPGDYRVEFTLPVSLAHYRSSVALSGSQNTSVLFASDGATGVNWAVHEPVQYCQADMEIVSTCYVGGAFDDTGTDSLGALVKIDRMGANEGRNQYVENIDQVGSTYGLAVQNDADGNPATVDHLLFAGAFLKSFSDYGPGFDADTSGTITNEERAGTIYVVDPSQTGGAATVLDHIVIPNAGSIARGQGADTDGPGGANPPDPGPDWDRDSAAFEQVTKMSLGDLEISDDGNTLFAVNLNDRHLYQVDISGGVGAFGTPVDLGLIPGPSCPGGDFAGAVGGDWRPFALAYHQGALYIGGVCSGETNRPTPAPLQTLNDPDNDTNGIGSSFESPPWDSVNDDSRTRAITDNISDVQLHVLRVTSALPGAASSLAASPVFSQTDMSFNRGSAGWFSTNNLERMPGTWNSWLTAFDMRSFYLDAEPFGYRAHYPQPILADIEFDRDGSMILGLRDRLSDQFPNAGGNPGLGGNGSATDPSDGDCNNATPDGGPCWTTNTQGDTNRACWIPDAGGAQVLNGQTGDWVFEGAPGCANDRRSIGELDPAAYDGPAGMAPGLGTNEYYWGDSMGSDPNRHDHQETSLGGLAYAPVMPDVVTSAMNPFDFSSGGLRYIDNMTGAETDAYEMYDGTLVGNFGKGAGLGDVELLCAPPPLEIGNRIWVDFGATPGVQDPGEPTVLDGVTVFLYNTNGTLVGQTTTLGGRYLFGGLTNAGILGGQALLPGQNYVIAIDPTDALLAGFSLTTTNVGANSQDQRDNDASTLSAGGQPWNGFWGVEFQAPAFGDHNHTFDIGLITTSSVSVTKSTSPAGAAQQFTFTLAPDPNATGSQAIGHGQTATWSGLPAGNYTLSEASVAGFTQGALTCTGITDTDGNANDASISFALQAGANVTCAITNTQIQPGSVTVTKTTSPSGAAQQFSFTLAPDPNTVGSQTIGDTQSASWPNLPAGTYTLSEAAAAGWTHGALTCAGVTDDDGDPSNASITFTLVAAADIQCAITNTEIAQPVFDLALRKTLLTGTVVPGEPVSFQIEVFNQGTVDALDVRVIDHVDLAQWEAFDTADNPPGTTTGDASLAYSWTADGIATISGTLAAGDSVRLPVVLTVAPGVTEGTTLFNYAEIDGSNNTETDQDSQPESVENDQNGDTLVDNEINNQGGDEDDHDVASVSSGSLYAIPTLGEWGLITLVLLILGTAWRRLRP